VSDRIASPRIVPRDVALLERRALALAAGEADSGEVAGATRFVLFRIQGLPCALEAAPVARAVSRLLGATPVPTLAGADRTIAFVEEQPLPVADLAGIAAGGERPANELAGGPAVVLSTAAGLVAVAVEGPLDLAEDRLAGTAREPSEGSRAGIRLAGRLADGTSVLDAAWLLGWAEKAARP
jgi:hypothetical protein